MGALLAAVVAEAAFAAGSLVVLVPRLCMPGGDGFVCILLVLLFCIVR
jgi:hypothetical protein